MRFNRTLIRIALLFGALLLLSLTVVVVNQVAQLYLLAAAFHPVAGQIVLFGLILAFVILAVTPVVMFIRLPPPLRPPASETDPSFPAHLQALRGRLKGNPVLKGMPLRTRADIEGALLRLDVEADEAIRRSASTVFMTTAISQHGSLDTLIVAASHTKLIWQLGRIYYQRPALRDFLWLYSNVAATAFVAGEIDDLDVSEHILPLVSNVAGGIIGSIPGLQTAATIFANSVFSGSVNAFLTLRVGFIAKRYCHALVLPDKRWIRRSAFAESLKFLGDIVNDGARKLSKALFSASTRRARSAVTGAGSWIWEAGGSIISRARRGGRTEAEPPDGLEPEPPTPTP
jgi:hypothetical protein